VRQNVAVEPEAEERRRGSGTGALVLLLLGGILLPVVGWFIGVVLLWRSDRWTRLDKVIGTLVVPGGLLLPLWVLGYYSLGAGWGACRTRPGTDQVVCVYQMSGRLAAGLVLGLTLASICSIVYLAHRRAGSPISEGDAQRPLTA
jgi:hypothetical protein